MTRISCIQQIKAAVRLEEIIQQRGVTLTPNQSGERLTGHCPFHQQDRTPSFNVYLSTQRYYCFGCGANGDVIDFVEQFDGCSRKEAMTRLSGKSASSLDLSAHHPRQLQTPTEPTEQPHYHAEKLTPTPQEDIDLLSTVAHCYHRALLATPAISVYLRQQRGITLEGMMRCRLGYTDGTVLATSQLPLAHQLPAAQIMGLLNASGAERMSHRVVIPEYAADGTCTWMIGRLIPLGRILRISFPPTSSHKYLGLSLPKPLLGYGAARKRVQVRDMRPLYALVVVEGAIDYVLLRQWDLPILPVALVGTHASFSQFSLLLDLQREAGDLPILLCLDADDAGRQGTARLQSQIAAQGRRVGVMLPMEQAKDIGDLGLRHDGRELVMQCIQQALATLAKGGQS